MILFQSFNTNKTGTQIKFLEVDCRQHEKKKINKINIKNLRRNYPLAELLPKIWKIKINFKREKNVIF